MRPIRTFSLKCCLATMLVMTSGGKADAQTGIDTALANRLQYTLDSLCTACNVKGIQAAAFLPGVGVWKGVTGVSYGSVPIDTTMLMSIGSITKTFVAAEIFKLIETGALSLTDTVGSLLPLITNVNGAITVQQLLGHTSGMGDFTNASWQAAMNSDLYATWYFPTVLPVFCSPATGAPGSAWSYRNANYTLLGMIIEAKKTDSLHHVLRSDFLSPYNLDNTYMEVFENYTNVIPHNWSTPTLNPALAADASATPHQALWSSVEPAGGYFSDAGNLAEWGYKLYSGKVISAASLAQMTSFTSVSSSYFTGYGLGCMRFQANGKTYYGHAGNYFGYAGSMLYYPQDSICVAVLVNQDCIATYEARVLMNTLLKQLATGVKQQVNANEIRVVPNPANAEFEIDIPRGAENTTVTMTDLCGREVYKTTASKDALKINTSRIEAGEYILSILKDTRKINKRIVVSH